MDNFIKSRARIRSIGVFFILAAISSVAALKLYDPVLQEDAFLHVTLTQANKVISGVLCELLLVISAVGTAITMYPYLKQQNPTFAIGYVSFRLLEVVFIMIGIISILTVVSISSYYADGNISLEAQAQNLGLTAIAVHDWTFILGPNFMLAVNTFLYSYTFYKSGMTPKWLSVLGLAASNLIMLAAILELYGIIEQLSLQGAILAVPIAAYEMTLAAWLIKHGKFRTT